MNLSPPEFKTIIDPLLGLATYADAGASGWRLLLEFAGLGEFVPGLNLSGPPKLVAQGIVSKLARLEEIPGMPGYRPLGALLATMESMTTEIPKSARAELAKLIISHQMVDDPQYLADLRTRHNLPAGPPLPTRVPVPPASFGAPADDDAMDSLEKVLNSEDNFLDVFALAGAIYAAQAVCRLEVPTADASCGTGFLVGPDLLLTNNHLLPGEAQAETATARFDYWIDPNGVANPGRPFRLDPKYFHTSSTDKCDYTLVRIKGIPLAEQSKKFKGAETIWQAVQAGIHRGFLLLDPRPVGANERVNIVQHPDGRPLKVVMTQNRVASDSTPTRVHYRADTMAGSSGSPVLDHRWMVVALHHSGAPYPRDGMAAAARRALRGVFGVNEGILIKAIMDDLAANKIDWLKTGQSGRPLS